MKVKTHQAAIAGALGAVYPLADHLQLNLVLNDRKGKLRVVDTGEEIDIKTGGLTFGVAPRVYAYGTGATR